jgi:hypothetical protein
MPQMTPQYGPAFPYRVGMLLFDGIQNGQKIYSQPGGIGTPVVPQPPTVNPPLSWKHADWKPAYPYCYNGLLSWGCGHWTNTTEVYQTADPYSGEIAALLTCPVCGYLGYIIEPASDWFQEFYSIFPVGIVQPGGGLIPSITP